MEINADFIGTDISLKMISMAKNNLKNDRGELLVADGFNMPLKSEIKFDLIHLDSVLHHLIGNTKSQSMHLVKLMLKLLTDRLSKNGILVIEEMHYFFYIIPNITSYIIFYRLKLLNFLHIDVSKIINEFQPGLEVNFLYSEEIEKFLESYGVVHRIKKIYGAEYRNYINFSF